MPWPCGWGLCSSVTNHFCRWIFQKLRTCLWFYKSPSGTGNCFFKGSDSGISKFINISVQLLTENWPLRQTVKLFIKQGNPSACFVLLLHRLLTLFHHVFIEWVLSFCLVSWLANLSLQNKNDLDQIVKWSSKLTEMQLNPESPYSRQVQRYLGPF